MSRADKIFFIGFPAALLIAWLFVGVLHVDDFEDPQDYPFIKKVPSFQFVFNDPYRSDPRGEESQYRTRMDSNGDWLPNTPELNDYLVYCRARYGIEATNPIEARTRCRAVSRSLKSR